MKFPFVSVRYCSLENNPDDLPNTWQLRHSAIEQLPIEAFGTRVAWQLSRQAPSEQARQNACRCVDIVARNRQNKARRGASVGGLSHSPPGSQISQRNSPSAR